MVGYFILFCLKRLKRWREKRFKKFKDMPAYTFLNVFLFNKVNIFSIQKLQSLTDKE